MSYQHMRAGHPNCSDVVPGFGRLGRFWGPIRLLEPLTSPLQPCVNPVHDANLGLTVPIGSGISWASSVSRGFVSVCLVERSHSDIQISFSYTHISASYQFAAWHRIVH